MSLFFVNDICSVVASRLYRFSLRLGLTHVKKANTSLSASNYRHQPKNTFTHAFGGSKSSETVSTYVTYQDGTYLINEILNITDKLDSENVCEDY